MSSPMAGQSLADYVAIRRKASPAFDELVGRYERSAAVYIPLSMLAGAALPYALPSRMVASRPMRLALTGLVPLMTGLATTLVQLTNFVDELQDMDIVESEKLREQIVSLKYNEHLKDGGDPDDFDAQKYLKKKSA